MNIAVYCSSSNHIADSYKKSAWDFGVWLSENNHTLVFGGATGGLMTAVSEGAASIQPHKIVGVIPQAVIKMNRQSSLCTELITVETMNERKMNMKNIADIFVIFPGSYGTLDELFDVVASGVVGEHKKPVIILNEFGFYDDLLHLVDKMKSEHFIPVENYKPLVVDNINACKKLIESFVF